MEVDGVAEVMKDGEEKEFEGVIIAGHGFEHENIYKDYLLAPLYIQVINWFMKTYNFHITSTFSWSNGYDGLIDTKDEFRLTGYRPTENEALTIAFEEALKLI